METTIAVGLCILDVLLYQTECAISCLQVLILVLLGVLFPLWSLIYMVIPCSSAVRQFFRRPQIKFICHCASYITFLGNYRNYLYFYDVPPKNIEVFLTHFPY